MRLRRRRWRTRSGFPLVKTVIALIILGMALLGLAMFVSRMAHPGIDSNLLGATNELPADRIETIKGSMKYSSLGSFAGIEPAIPGVESAGFVRMMIIRHVGGDRSDPGSACPAGRPRTPRPGEHPVTRRGAA